MEVETEGKEGKPRETKEGRGQVRKGKLNEQKAR